MRILSIDFDYFQTVDADTVRRYYPDGIDVPTSLSTAVWALKYSDEDAEKAISEVKINEEEIKEAKRLLTEQSPDCPVLISNTHKDIYDFAVTMMEDSGSEELWVTNVDMHHDMFNDNSELDCGNWVSFLQKKYPDKMGIAWIANPTSKTAYGFSDDEWQHIGSSISQMRYRKYDAIFLCRSDAWLPPHLDQSFDDMVKFISERFTDVWIEPCVTEPRNCEETIIAIEKSKAITSQNDKKRYGKTLMELD